MHRLTVDKPTSEMSMTELAHNSCYARNRWARYRNYDLDIDAIELVMKLYEYYCNEDFEDICNDEFDNWIEDYMQYNLDSLEGLLAAFYTHIWAMADLREKLKDYEDLEEQGKLLKEWIPSEEPPESGKYVLLSFENFSVPLVGRYEEDEEGDGAFYVGDDEESCISQDIIVNAWMPLPELYKN